MGELQGKADTKAQIRWRCHRGMLELDILLLSFFDAYYDDLDEKQVRSLTSLLACQDPDIFAWLMGHQACDNMEVITIVQLIQHHHRTKES